MIEDRIEHTHTHTHTYTHRSFITWVYSTMHEQITSIETKVSSSTIDLGLTHLRMTFY